MSSEDRELARRCQQGDVGAYGEFVRRHRRMVYRLVRGVLGCAEDAEDAVQETFLRAYRAIHTYDQRYLFVAWVRRIAVNCAVSRIRQRERQQARDRAAPHNPGAGADPEHRLTTSELQGQVHEVVRQLPLKQRLAVTLFHLRDMNLAETAQALGCSVGAVKCHLHRARQRLAGHLASRLEEE